MGCHKLTATRAFAFAVVREGKNDCRAEIISEPPDNVSLLVALNERYRVRTAQSNQLNRVVNITRPTINGTLANFPSRIDFVGNSEKSWPSITGWNTLYPEAVLYIQRLSAKKS